MSTSVENTAEGVINISIESENHGHKTKSGKCSIECCTGGGEDGKHNTDEEKRVGNGNDSEDIKEVHSETKTVGNHDVGPPVFQFHSMSVAIDEQDDEPSLNRLESSEDAVEAEPTEDTEEADGFPSAFEFQSLVDVPDYGFMGLDGSFQAPF
ncbi:hypothetical protein JTB14_008399 [Gonioctena quinquepunctata]|nr:hypothetical protein JTB14_008399 [Gonioctena quinquepunctata]